MALSLPSLDIINTKCHQSFLLEGSPETFDLHYDTLPPTMFSFEADNYQNFGSSMLGIDQIDQILVPNCYNSSQKKEEEYNTLINTFDPNYVDNSRFDGIEEDMFEANSQAFSHPTRNQAGYVQDRVSQKRHIEGGEAKMSKKQCGIHRKKETRVTSPSKDTQSLAAKNRRKRISERLRVLQELVPNGTKVDLVTMLEKAISYVKFLQLQVQVLETDELWPDQGGKALDISQVEDAIDSILSSCQNNDNSICDKK